MSHFVGLGVSQKITAILRKDGGEYGELSVAAIDDPSRIRRSRDIGVYLGLVPRARCS